MVTGGLPCHIYTDGAEGTPIGGFFRLFCGYVCGAKNVCKINGELLGGRENFLYLCGVFGKEEKNTAFSASFGITQTF